MKTGWGHVINESGVDELFAPNTLAPQVLIAEEGPTLVEALQEKLDNRFAVIETAHIQDAAIISAKIAEAAIEDAHIAIAGISTAKIKDLTADILRAVVANIQEVTAGTVSTNELYAQLIMAVSAELKKVTAGEVETNALYAEVIKSVCADLENVAAGEVRTHVLQAVAADIDSLSAGELYTNIISAVQADVDLLSAGRLYAGLSELNKATIKEAEIDFAQVKDLVAGEAIITKGVGGQLYISRLAVNEANMVSLTAGELVVKGMDGKFYTFQVDENGNVTTIEKLVTNDEVADGSLSGEKIVEKSITATQLNVQEIFANSALVGAITAENLNAATLFVDTAFVSELKTHLVNSDYLAVVIQDSPGLLTNMSMFFNFTTEGLVIKQPNSQFSVKISDTELGFYQSGQRVAYISNSQLLVERIKVEKALTIGRYEWKAETNGSISFVGLGV